MHKFLSFRNIAFLFLVAFYTIVVTVSQRNAFYIPALLIFFLGSFLLISDAMHRDFKYFSLSGDEFKILAAFAFITLYALGMLYVWEMPGQRNKADLLFLLAFPLYLTVRRIDFSAKQFFIAIAIGCAITGMVGIYDCFVLHKDRAFDGRVLIIPASGVAMTMALMTLHVVLKKVFESRWINCLLLVSVLLGFTCVVLSGSRGVWVAFPAYLFFYFFAYYDVTLRKFLIFTSVLIALGLVLWFWPDSYFEERLRFIASDINNYSNGNVNTSLGLRFQFWTSAWDGFLKKPIIGWGTDGYYALKAMQAEQGLISSEAANINLSGGAHNHFLDALVKKGIIGFLAVIFVLYLPLRFFLKSRKYGADKSAVCACELGVILVVSTIIYGLTDDYFRWQFSAWFYVVTSCVLLAISAKRPVEAAVKNRLSGVAT